MPLTYEKKEKGDLVLVEFKIEGGVIDVLELPEAVEKAPLVDGKKVVCISGRGPIWLHSSLAHKYHYARAVAHYDPRLGGCVIVASHHPKYKVGQVIPVD